MAKFIRKSVSKILTSSDRKIKVEIVKFQKVGTRRMFYAPVVKGKRIDKTMFARRNSAETLARSYIKYKVAAKKGK